MRPPERMQEGTDYLYCPVCRIHVACRRVESGGWEVSCPGCRGECGFCDCYLKRFCFGSRGEFPPFRPKEGACVWPFRRNRGSR